MLRFVLNVSANFLIYIKIVESSRIEMPFQGRTIAMQLVHFKKTIKECINSGVQSYRDALTSKNNNNVDDSIVDGLHFLFTPHTKIPL